MHPANISISHCIRMGFHIFDAAVWNNSVLYNEFQGIGHKNCIVLPECAYINVNSVLIKGVTENKAKDGSGGWGPMAWLSRVAWGLWSGAFESIYFHTNCIVVIQSFLSTALNCIVMLHHMYIKSFLLLKEPIVNTSQQHKRGTIIQLPSTVRESSAASLWVLEVSLKKVMTT